MSEYIFHNTQLCHFYECISNSFLQLCFAYKGMLRDEVGLKFTYLNSQGIVSEATAKINTLFTKGNK